MTVTDTTALEPTASDLAWAAQYLRHPGKVPAARRYQVNQAAMASHHRTVAVTALRRLAALDAVLADADRCRDCGKALKTKASRARGVGPECLAKEREANRG